MVKLYDKHVKSIVSPYAGYSSKKVIRAGNIPFTLLLMESGEMHFILYGCLKHDVYICKSQYCMHRCITLALCPFPFGK